MRGIFVTEVSRKPIAIDDTTGLGGPVHTPVVPRVVNFALAAAHPHNRVAMEYGGFHEISPRMTVVRPSVPQQNAPGIGTTKSGKRTKQLPVNYVTGDDL